MNTLRAHSLAIGSLLALCTLAAGLRLATVPLTPNSDYQSYLDTAELFAGHHAPQWPQRILKPLAPLTVTALAPLSGYPTGFLLEVVAGYLAFALLLYALAYAYFEDRWLAWLVAFLGALSYPMLRYGLDLYTEGGAQALYLLSLLLTLRYLKAPSRKLLIYNGLALGIGLLWKEYGLVAGLAYGLVLLFESASWRTKLANLALLALCSLAPSVLVQLWVYASYHYTYLDWYVTGGASGFATQFTAHNLIKSTGALLTLAWLLVPVGIWRWPELKQYQWRFLAVLIPSSLFVLAWGYVSSRLFYVMAPAFLLLAVWGMARWPRWLQALIIAVAILINAACVVVLSA